MEGDVGVSPRSKLQGIWLWREVKSEDTKSPEIYTIIDNNQDQAHDFLDQFQARHIDDGTRCLTVNDLLYPPET